MHSIFAREAGCGPLRLRWRGYDRQQVDECLSRAAIDRQRLEERVAQLEAVITRESLTPLRGEIANRLNRSFGALRRATDLLAAMTPASLEQRDQGHEVSTPPAPSTAVRQARFGRTLFLTSWGGKRFRPTLALGAGLAATLLFLSLYDPSASESPAPPVALVTTRQVPERVAEPARVADRSEGIVLTLTALQACWIRARVDGEPRLERLLNPDETITLRGLDEVVLRVGNAAALSLLINNWSAKPLGASGQAVTVRITPSNYATLLKDNADL